jgi:polysaccharide deacetylase family protein (PEP-CTERM system associated)
MTTRAGPGSASAPSKCTLSIDWEDFGQQYTKYHYGIETAPLRAIDRQTNIILDLLDEAGHKATFFILGMLAKHRPDQVKQISSRGHEIGIHGQTHEVMFKLTPDDARRDLETAAKTVSDITGLPLYGYRAPVFSVRRSNLYVLEILTELGLVYDSSIFPVKLARYGIEGFNERDALYRLPNGKAIVELPLSVVSFLGKKWPVSGGGYIRLMPEFLVSSVFRKLSAEGRDSIIYMHPYEFDTETLDVSANYPRDANYSRLRVLALNLRWNVFRKSVVEKVRRLLKEHQFITCLEKAKHVASQGNSSELLGFEK